MGCDLLAVRYDGIVGLRNEPGGEAMRKKGKWIGLYHTARWYYTN
jgi:hypothetical protein